MTRNVTPEESMLAVLTNCIYRLLQIKLAEFLSSHQFFYGE